MTNTLEDYRKLLEFLRQGNYENHLNEIVQGDYYPDEHDEESGQILYEHNGQTYDLALGWWDQIEYDNDNAWQHYWQFDKADEYAIYVEGYYNSWDSGDIDSYGEGFRVGKLSTRVVTFINFDEV